jgi:uncharacterized membrane protein
MDIMYISDLIAIGLSVALIGGYHAWLRNRVKKTPAYTIQAVLNQGRHAWVERVIREKEGILAVQTLRNAIMGATFFASTAVILLVGTLTLTGQASNLSQSWHALNPFFAIDERLWLVKLLLLLLDLLSAFVCFSQAIRLLSHVGMMLAVPPSTTVTPSFVAGLLIRAGLYHTRGMRCYYFAVPLLFWLFGPVLLVVASCGLVVALYYLDKSPTSTTPTNLD